MARVANVFILLEDDYEGSYITAVYAEACDAEMHRKALEEKGRPHYHVEEWDVG